MGNEAAFKIHGETTATQQNLVDDKIKQEIDTK